MNDDLPRDPLIDAALERYSVPGVCPDDWATISARAERRRPQLRGVAVGGVAVAACTALAVLSVALIRGGDANTSSESRAVASENPYSDLAGARTGDVTLRLIGPGDHDPSGRGECFVDLVVRGVSRGFICAPRALFDRSGFVAGTRDRVGAEVTIYGVLPVGADGVRIPGNPPVEFDGRLFSTVVGPTAPRTVQFTLNGVVIPQPSGDDGPIQVVPDATTVTSDRRGDMREHSTTEGEKP